MQKYPATSKPSRQSLISKQPHSPLLIVGMHRTGTSAVGAALHEMGYQLATSELSSDDKQQYFEDPQVVALNDRVLATLSRDWRTPGLMPPQWLQDSAIQTLIEEACELVSRLTGAWALKDPRFCLLLPLWLQALERQALTPRVLLTYRHPAEVAASLNTRDQIPEEVGYLLWVAHILSALRDSSGVPRTLIRYDDLIDDPHAVLGELSRWLNIDNAPGLAKAELAIDAAAKHHFAEAHAPLPDSARRLMEILSDRAIALDNTGLQQELDEMRVELDSAWRLLGGGLQAYDRLMHSWENNYAETDHQLKKVRAALETHRDSLEQQNKVIEIHENAHSEREAGFKQAVDMLMQRDTELLEARAQIDQLESELATARARWQMVHTDDTADHHSADGDGELIYDSTIDLRVDNNAHTRVIRYLQDLELPAGSRVLEVGCAGGHVGEAIRRLGFEVWGIETNAHAVGVARQRLDQVYQGRVEDFLAEARANEVKFTAITFGDVLEHLLDPEQVLADCRHLLEPDGVVIASIPNVAHASVRIMLLEGRWDYGGYGIMDKTHLRFYTRDTFVDLLTDSGYAVDRLSSIHLSIEDAGIRINPLLHTRVADLLQDREQDVFQFVAMARPSEDPELATSNSAYQIAGARHRILLLPPVAEGSLFSIRLGDPLRRLTEIFGGEVRVAHPHDFTSNDLDWADTIVFQRETDERIYELIRRLRKAGKRVVFDLDDYLLDVPEYLSVYEHCKALRPLLEQTLAEVDVISASTAPLRERLLPLNPNVYITPNYAWSTHEPIGHYDTDEPVRLIVASSDTVRVDFLIGALKKVQATLDVEIVGIGPPGLLLQEFGVETIYHPLMQHDHFKAFITSRDNTVGIIPLDDNEFNQCKSAVKFFDYSLAGVPCVCSAVLPYATVIEDPKNGILCLDDEESWVQALTVMVRETDRRRRTADAARTQCLEQHNLNVSAYAWNELLEHTAFPLGDPVYETPDRLNPGHRTPWQLLRGTLRHLARKESYLAVWRIYREEGWSGVRTRWQTVF